MGGTRPIGRRGLTFGVASIVLAPVIARSQDYPSKPVHVVVPYPAGGGTDIVARLIMPRLSERWKQTIIVDNRAGASGIVGSEIVARSSPDGYTLLVTTSAHTITPYTTRRLSYDTERDFTPITVLVSARSRWWVRPKRASTVSRSSSPPRVPRPASTSSAAPTTPHE